LRVAIGTEFLLLFLSHLTECGSQHSAERTCRSGTGGEIGQKAIGQAASLGKPYVITGASEFFKWCIFA